MSIPESKVEAEFLGVADAGRILGVGPQRVRHLEKEGRLKALRTAGGVRLFRLEEVQRLARERAQRSRGGR